MRDHDDPELIAYLDAERAYYDAVTARLAGLRAGIAASLRAREPAEEHGCPWAEGGAPTRPATRRPPSTRGWSGGARTPTGPRRSSTSAPRSGDAAYAELGLAVVSDDGTILAYSLDLTGDEVYELRFRDLASGVDLPDRVARTYYGGAFTADGSAFYYTVHDRAYRPFQVWRHRLGSTVEADELVLQEDDRRFELEVGRSRSGDFVLVSAASRTTRQDFAIDAHDPAAPALPVRGRVPGVEDAVEHQRTEGGGRWLVVTNDGEPEFRLLGAEVAHWSAGRALWREVVAGREGQRLESCNAFAGHVVLGWRVDAQPLLEVWPSSLVGPPTVLRNEPAGTLRLGRNRDYAAEGVVVEATSLVDPSVWSLVPFGGESASRAGGGPSIAARRRGTTARGYVTERLLLPARDGTPVPVTVAYAAVTPLDGTAPGLIWAYGAYESCDWPSSRPCCPSGWTGASSMPRRTSAAGARAGGPGGTRAIWPPRSRRSPTSSTSPTRSWPEASSPRTRCRHAGAVRGRPAPGRGPDDAPGPMARGRRGGALRRLRHLDARRLGPLTVNEWEEWGDPIDGPPTMRGCGPTPPTRTCPSRPGRRPGVPAPSTTRGSWSTSRRSGWPSCGSVAPDGAVVLFRAETGPGAHTGPAGRYAALDYEAEVMAFVIDAVQDARPSRNVE